MRELLKTLGFQFSTTCNCNGKYTEKYRNGILDVWIRPKSYTFLIRRYGTRIGTWVAIDGAGSNVKKAIEDQLKKEQPIT